MTDREFWETVAPVRIEHVERAWLLMDEWLDRIPDDGVDRLFEHLVIAWVRLTPGDREVLLDSALDLLGEPPLRVEALKKWERLRRMADRIALATEHSHDAHPGSASTG
jgi:hypothetical protein